MGWLRNEVTGLLAGLRMSYVHRQKFGRWPRVLRPRTFNERMIHRALFDRDPQLRVMSDKLAVRKFIAGKVGDRYVVPVLGEWADPRQIDFALLPEGAVYKPRGSSGRVLVTEEGVPFDKAKLVRRLRKWARRPKLREAIRLEWGYHGIPPTIIAEPLLLGPDGGPAPDLDVYVFRGKVALLRPITGRKHSKQRRDAYFDRDGRQVETGTAIVSSRQSLAPEIIAEAIEVSEKLAAGSDSMRVDFYITADGLKVGELTPYSWAGSAGWRHREHDLLYGNWWAAGADTSQLADFIDPVEPTERCRPISPTETAGRWLSRFEGAVNARDFAAARLLFSTDVLGFGSVSAEMVGREALEKLQWRPVWTSTSGFRFLAPRVVSQSHGILVVVSRWSSEGEAADGSLFPRKGRCTLVLHPGQTNMLCVHSHFSMEPVAAPTKGS